jgi:hypothetical protein
MKPFHPDYGLTDDYRIRTVAHAQISGVTAAAKMNRVGQTTVRSWCERMDVQPLRLQNRTSYQKKAARIT